MVVAATALPYPDFGVSSVPSAIYSAGTHVSFDRTEPQIGAFVLLQIYNKWGDGWLVDLLIDDMAGGRPLACTDSVVTLVSSTAISNTDTLFRRLRDHVSLMGINHLPHVITPALQAGTTGCGHSAVVKAR